jgi:hypothetical protein
MVMKKTAVGCKVNTLGKIMTLDLKKKSWPIYVPAAAVIHKRLALSVFIGCKGCVDGKSSYF